MSYEDLADRLRKRFLDAEGQTLKDRPPEKNKKVRWFKTHCPKCDYEVEYAPKENWDGQLTCPQCQNNFQLTLLSHFAIEYRDEENEK